MKFGKVIELTKKIIKERVFRVGGIARAKLLKKFSVRTLALIWLKRRAV